MNLIDCVQEYVEYSGNGKWCEDKVLVSKAILGVLDGATPIDVIEIDNYQTQACWFVNSFGEGFARHKSEQINSVDSFCEELIEQIDKSKISGLQEFNCPCSTAAFLRLYNSRLLISILGDCHVFVFLKDTNVLHFYDNRVDKFSKRTLNISQNNFQTAIEKEKAIREQKINNRICLNTRLFKEYGIITPKSFFENDLTLLKSVNLLREYEMQNKYNNCVKTQDDVSAILLNTTLGE